VKLVCPDLIEFQMSITRQTSPNDVLSALKKKVDDLKDYGLDEREPLTTAA